MSDNNNNSTPENKVCDTLIGSVESWAIRKSVDLFRLAQEAMEAKTKGEKRGVVWIGFRSPKEAQKKKENMTTRYVPNNAANRKGLHFMKNKRLELAMEKYDPAIHFVLVVSIDNATQGGGCMWRWSVMHGDACNRITKTDLMHAALLPGIASDSEDQISVFGGVAACGGPGCKKRDTKLQRCKGCKTVYYCSVECQKEHWPKHGPMCRAIMKLRETFTVKEPAAEPAEEPKEPSGEGEKKE